MKAKKSLGQHFLTQPKLAQRMADAIISLPDVASILEVGPGKGILTQYLVKRPEDLYLVELDKDMLPILSTRFGDLTIHYGDFLKLNIIDFISGPFHLVGNFPYNISSQILFRMLDHRSQIPQMVGMFQKEVAQRISSDHGSKKYGILSVLMQAYYEVDYLFSVGPSSFSPPPKVNSGVIRLVRRNVPLVPPVYEKIFRRVVKMAFNQRRKMLRNSLKSILPPVLDNPIWQLRPEQLSVQDFANLAMNLISSQQE